MGLADRDYTKRDSSGNIVGNRQATKRGTSREGPKPTHHRPRTQYNDVNASKTQTSTAHTSTSNFKDSKPVNGAYSVNPSDIIDSRVYINTKNLNKSQDATQKDLISTHKASPKNTPKSTTSSNSPFKKPSIISKIKGWIGLK